MLLIKTAMCEQTSRVPRSNIPASGQPPRCNAHAPQHHMTDHCNTHAQNGSDINSKGNQQTLGSLRRLFQIPYGSSLLQVCRSTCRSESWDYAWSSMKSDDHREKTMLLIKGASHNTMVKLHEYMMAIKRFTSSQASKQHRTAGS